MTSKGQTIIQDSVLSNQAHILVVPQYHSWMSDTTKYVSINVETGVTLDWVKCNVTGYSKNQNLTFSEIVYIKGSYVQDFWSGGLQYAYSYICDYLELSYK
jgi:hypothetical protein